MEATELRIGNYVFLKSKKKNWEILEGYEIDLGCDSDDFEPIPLTEEILLKCGFEYYKESKSYELDCDFSVTIWGKYDSENNLHVSCDEIGIEIHYLHQLQNLYFALTGKELEINL